MAFQDLRALHWRTVLGQSWPSARGRRGAAARARGAGRAAIELGQSARRRDAITRNELSGGMMRKRVALARALANGHPGEILIRRVPLAAIDSQTRTGDAGRAAAHRADRQGRQ